MIDSFKPQEGTVFECNGEEVCITVMGITVYVRKSDVISYASQLKEKED